MDSTPPVPMAATSALYAAIVYFRRVGSILGLDRRRMRQVWRADGRYRRGNRGSKLCAAADEHGATSQPGSPCPPRSSSATVSRSVNRVGESISRWLGRRARGIRCRLTERGAKPHREGYVDRKSGWGKKTRRSSGVEARSRRDRTYGIRRERDHRGRGCGFAVSRRISLRSTIEPRRRLPCSASGSCWYSYSSCRNSNT